MCDDINRSNDALLELIQDEFAKLHQFVDRRISEVSSEVSASIQFMEMNEESINHKILSLKKDLGSVLNSDKKSDWENGGLELEYIADITNKAVNNILDKLEHVESLLAANIDNELVSKQIKKLIIGIYSDCEFQDLVGQRVKRVRERIKDVNEIISSTYEDTEEKTIMVVDENHTQEVATKAEIKQEDIDKLFESKRT